MPQTPVASSSSNETQQNAFKYTNSNKRFLSPDATDSERDIKKTKMVEVEPSKKRRRRKRRKAPVVDATPESSLSSVQNVATRRVLATDEASEADLSDAEPTPPNSYELNGCTKSESEHSTRHQAKTKTKVSKSAEAAEIIRLTQELEAKSKLLTDHQQLLSQFQQSLTCQICLDPMFKPYALSPCGHIICYNCLVQWFTAQPVDGPTQPAYARKKSCPHCRANVKTPPVQVWGLKSMVMGLASSGLLPGVLTPTDNPRPPGDTNSRNPWSGIFTPPSTARPNAAVHRNVQLNLGYLDVEDGGIRRCLACMHEIWEGVCTGCELSYDWDQDPDWDDERVYMEEEEGDESSYNWDGHMLWDTVYPGWGSDYENHAINRGRREPYEHWWTNRRRRELRARFAELNDGHETEPGTEDEDEYESSFIDDSETQQRSNVPFSWTDDSEQ